MRIHLAKRTAATFFTLAASVAWLAGCSQTRYRLSADQEAYCTIEERNTDPRWAQPSVRIDIDPRSRYFDPYDPDASPMPPDDPASHRYMHLVAGRQGWKHWEDFGVRSELENPQWRERLGEYVELDSDGEVKLDIDSSIRLAYIHSPLHQRSLETLYLSALDVTGERFRLDTQFFGGTAAQYEHQGNLASPTIIFVPGTGYVVAGPFSRPERNRLTLSNDIQATRRLATAGEVLVGFANSFALEFTGGDVSLAGSLANFSFIQPLLRGGGRHIALEQLTLAERRLLANLRAYSQFRQGFFTLIMIGELGVRGPQRGNPDTSLQSFSGFGSVGGYLGLLQQSQQIRNTEDNLRLQLRTRDRLEALFDNELIDIVQVDQFRQSIEATRANLLDQTNSLALSVDNYKTQILGLPSDLPVQVDQELVEQFQLIPVESYPIVDAVLSLQRRIGNVGELLDLDIRIADLESSLDGLQDQQLDDVELFLLETQAVIATVARRLRSLATDIERVQQMVSSDEQAEGAAGLKSMQDSIEQINAELAELPSRFQQALERLDDLLNQLTEENFSESAMQNRDWIGDMLTICRTIVRLQSLLRDVDSEPQRSLEEAKGFVESVEQLFEIAQADIERMDAVAPDRERRMSAEEKELFRRDRRRIVTQLAELRTGEVGFDAAVAELRRIEQAFSAETRQRTLNDLTAWIQSFVQLVERLALVPAQARLEVIVVEPVELDADQAFGIALANRLDFMNGRAALVDRWRAIQIAANALQSNLTITGSGDISTARNNPVSFRAPTSTLRLGLEFDAPLARLLERNGYRETLIQYQRSRRDFIQSRDALQKGLRSLLRTLEQRRLQLEIQRRAVSIALRRVEQTQLALLAPPPPVPPGARPQINPTTAINLLGAQSSLQSSQNSFLSAWLDYYAARLRLYREMGVLQLDEQGKWIDTPLQSAAPAVGAGSDDAEYLPPPLPIEVTEGDHASISNDDEVLRGTSVRQGESADLTVHRPNERVQAALDSPAKTSDIDQGLPEPQTVDASPQPPPTVYSRRQFRYDK